MSYLQLLPILIELIQLAEKILGAKTGPEKKAFVLEAVTATLKGISENKTWLDPLVEVLVKLLKLVKII